MEKRMKKPVILILAALLLLAGCVLTVFVKSSKDGENMPGRYRQISQEDAKVMMERNDGHVVVDVRRQDEFDAGHIPGAICIPNESIAGEPPAELPDFDQTILLYCRSGRRSKEAAQKLCDMGYTRLYEFGGILDWTGEIVTESGSAQSAAPAPLDPDPGSSAPSVPEKNAGKTATLVFDSFDGGGPEYTVSLKDPSIVAFSRLVDYPDKDHEQMDGSPYRVILSFMGMQPGETELTISARSPIADNYDNLYAVRVDGDLNISIELLHSSDSGYDAVQPTAQLVMEVNGKIFYPAPADTPAAKDLLDKLEKEALTLELREYGGFEKVGPLPFELPQDDEKITTQPGDILLYRGDQLTVFYDSNTWDYTRLARIDHVSKEELAEAFGKGDAAVSFWLEWSE